MADFWLTFWAVFFVFVIIAVYSAGGVLCVYCWRETYDKHGFSLYTIGLLLMFFLWPLAIIWFGPICLIHKVLDVEIYGVNPDSPGRKVT